MRCVRALLSFYTRIPVGAASLEEVYGCTGLLPLIGLLEALIVSAPLLALPGRPLVAAALATLLHVAVTGGLHLDGLADYADAALAGARGEDARRVMKDPRLGSGGVLAIALHSILSYTVYAEAARLPPLDTLALMAASYVTAAYSMVLAPLVSTGEPPEGLGRLYRGYAQRSLGSATLLATVLLAATLIASRRVLPAIASGLATLLLFSRDAEKRLGYVSGDVIGAMYEAVRLAALLAAILA